MRDRQRHREKKTVRDRRQRQRQTEKGKRNKVHSICKWVTSERWIRIIYSFSPLPPERQTDRDRETQRGTETATETKGNAIRYTVSANGLHQRDTGTDTDDLFI